MSIPCPRCRKATTDGLLDSDCTDEVRKALKQLPMLMRDLQITYTRQSQAGTGGGGSGATPVPYDKTASKVAADVVLTVGTWIRNLAQNDLAEQVEGCSCAPYRACRGYVDVPLTSSMTAWCKWLDDRILRIRRHPAAAAIVNDLTHAVDRGNRAIDPHAFLKFCGFCVGERQGVRCNGQLWAVPGEHFTACPVCKASYDVALSREKLLREAEGQLASASAILTAIPDAYGVMINANTFHSWVARGRLLTKGSRDGVAVYRVGDAIALARTAATRRKAS